MDTVYHYCSVQSFLAILASKRLWLSDATKMNDSQEGLWADRLIDELLVDEKTSMSDQDRKEFVIGYNLNRRRSYQFCLSSEPDILSQWRAYAGDATGLAIGFDSSSFPRQINLPATNAAPKFNTGLWEVIYERQEQQKLIRLRFDNARSAQDICVAEGGKVEYQLLGAVMAGACPLLKNPAFREEKELRLIHTPHLMTDEKNNLKVVGSDYPINQRVSNGQIVTYFEYPLSDLGVDIVKEVWVGPRSRLGKHDIELALAINQHGSTQVKNSSATYR